MYAKTLLLALFAALAALTTVQACSDDKDFTWTYTFNGKEFTQHCSFLSIGNADALDRRRNNHCPKPDVKSNCKKSCDNCGSSEPTCADDTRYTFSFRFNGKIHTRNCSFLITEHRRSRFCPTVKKHCRKSCDNCQAANPCSDDSTFTFTPDGRKGGAVNCKWLVDAKTSDRNAKRQADNCYAYVGKSLLRVRDSCKKSCSVCTSSTSTSDLGDNFVSAQDKE